MLQNVNNKSKVELTRCVSPDDSTRHDNASLVLVDFPQKFPERAEKRRKERVERLGRIHSLSYRQFVELFPDLAA